MPATCVIMNIYQYFTIFLNNNKKLRGEFSMFFRQFFDEKLAQHSYLVGCQKTGEAIIIDPKRVLDDYEKVAKAEGLKITHATETHIHADFASGLRDVSRKFDATLFVSDEGDAEWKYQNMPKDTVFLKDRDIFHVGNIHFEVIATPGHTPESISFVVRDNGVDEPMGIFTGDFLFVGDVGRPDLLEKAAHYEGTTEIGAKDLYDSLKKLDKYPDYLQIWPGHGAGSACGKSLGAVPLSTLGYERQFNWALNTPNKAAFVEEITDAQPEPPNYFAKMKQVNKEGLPEFNLKNIPTGTPETLVGQIFDLRRSDAFADGFITGSINLPYNKGFVMQAGWFLDYNQPLTIIGDVEKSKEYQKDLASIGFDNIERIVSQDDIADLINDSYEKVSPETFIENYKNKNVLDVRGLGEYNAGNVENSIHRHHGTMQDASIPFDKDEDIYVHCKGGGRSAIAVSVLKARGYKNAKNVLKGYDGFKDKI